MEQQNLICYKFLSLNWPQVLLSAYEKAVSSVEPEWRKLFAAYLTNIRRSLEPALESITWCKKEGLAFADHCIDEIAVFQDLINRANDIYQETIQSD
jgi:hypothetical protein